LIPTCYGNQRDIMDAFVPLVIHCKQIYESNESQCNP